MKFPDQIICEQIQLGKKSEFNKLMKKYSNFINHVCLKEFESSDNNIHLQMVSGYKNIVEDITSMVMLDIYQCIMKKITFKNEYSLQNLLRVIAKRKVKSAKRKSIRYRKNTFIKDSSNTFISNDHNIDQDLIDNNVCEYCKLFDTESYILQIRSEYKDLSSKLVDILTARELSIYKLIVKDCELHDRKYYTQNRIAQLLGISERTVRNDLKNIKEKAELIRYSASL